MTREQAEAVMVEQRDELVERGATNVRFSVKCMDGEWYVDGSYDLDVETDSVWGPIVEELKEHGA
jgi:hypothetical protein